MPASTALVRLRPGQRQPPRLDCVRGGPDDSGHRIAALYFLPPHKRPLSVAEAAGTSNATPPLPPPPDSSGSGGGNDGAASGERSQFGGDLVLFNVAAPGGSVESSERSSAAATEVATTSSTMDSQTGSIGGASVVASQADRLVLWRADGTRNERTPCVSTSNSPAVNNDKSAATSAESSKDGADEDTCADLYAVAFWMHGVEL